MRTIYTDFELPSCITLGHLFILRNVSKNYFALPLDAKDAIQCQSKCVVFQELCLFRVRAFERHLARRNPLLHYLEVPCRSVAVPPCQIFPFSVHGNFIPFPSQCTPILLGCLQVLSVKGPTRHSTGSKCLLTAIAMVARPCKWNYTRGKS